MKMDETVPLLLSFQNLEISLAYAQDLCARPCLHVVCVSDA
jgi:hypothetical protein